MTVFSQSSEDYNQLKNLFQQQKYQQVYDRAKEIRSQQYGKNWKTDYFISIALCAGGETNNALRAFNYSLNTYKRDLTDKQFDFLLHERDLCSSNQTYDDIPQNFIASLVSTVDHESSAGVSGKMGFIVDCRKDTHSFDVDAGFDNSGLEERIFEVDKIQEAISYYHNMLGSGYSVGSKGRFLVITPGSGELRATEVDRITDELEKVYHFYEQEFGLRLPDKLIAVYLMNNRANLRKVAKKIHGLLLPESNIGYSCLADLSVLGTSDRESIGTIKHELFHLMIRGDVGDIPNWLDEAVACIYETSRWNGNDLNGDVQNWRSEFLINLLMPTMESVINKNHRAFSPAETADNCEMALNYAVAKEFGLFLQNGKMLEKVITGFKNRVNVFSDASGPDESDLDVLERVFGKPMTEIQNDFDEWISNVYYRINVIRNASTALHSLNEMSPCNKNDLRNKADEWKTRLTDLSGTLSDDIIVELNRYLLDVRFQCYNH